MTHTAIAMRTAVPLDLYCYTNFDYTVIAVCCNVLYKTHLIAYGGYLLQYCDKDKITFQCITAVPVFNHFYRTMLCISAVYAVMRCPSVCHVRELCQNE